MKLGEEGQKLLNQYIETLKISKEDAQKIIHLNVSAFVFLSGESGLRMRNSNTNLSMLLRTTIFRKFNDFEPIRDEEILKIKDHYEIDIKSQSNNVFKRIK